MMLLLTSFKFEFNVLIIRRLLLVILFLIGAYQLQAQFVPSAGQDRAAGLMTKRSTSNVVGRKDLEPTNATLIFFGGAVGLPGGDLAQRYGLHGEANLAGYFKTKSNWLFGLELGYLFGEDVKENTLGDLLTPEGLIIGRIGRSSTISLQQRGLKLPFLKVGKLFVPSNLPAFMDKQASGFFATAGVGYFQHQISIAVNSELEFLQGKGGRGYDRMCSGVALNETLGFMMMHRQRWYGAYAAVDFVQGFTQSQRYDFSTNSYDGRIRNDLTYNLRLGLILPIFPISEAEVLYD